MVVQTDPLPWFALYVKPRHEKNVELILRGKGLEPFLPTYIRLSTRSKRYELPLFPGYIFCRSDITDYLLIRATPGVFSIVGHGNTPSPVPDEEVDRVKRLIQSGLTPKAWPYTSVGYPIRLESGPLRGVQGVIVDAEDKKWLVVSVNLLQRSVAVKIDRNLLS
jgi:transcription antitermination factor NusG